MNVLSLFDGMSCGQIALDQLKIKVDNYFASEIDKHAIKVAQSNYQNTIQLGCVTNINTEDLPKIDLLIGGSPCQGFSFAGKQLNFDDPRSKLFFEFVRVYKECKDKNPNVKFLLENVVMKKEFQNIISKKLGVEPILINSSLVSAQNRRRLYWTNITGVEQPEDSNIFVGDILESEVADKYLISGGWKKWLDKNSPIRLKKKLMAVNPKKAITMTARQYANWSGNFITCVAQRGRYLIDGKRQDHKIKTAGKTTQRLEARKDGKTNCLTTVQKDNYVTNWENIRKLTPVECERLQTVPDNYTAAVSETQRYKMLGNGWTIKIIAHILSFGNFKTRNINENEIKNVMINKSEYAFVADISAADAKERFTTILEKDHIKNDDLIAVKDLLSFHDPIRSHDKRYDGKNWLLIMLLGMPNKYRDYLQKITCIKTLDFTGKYSIFAKIITPEQYVNAKYAMKQSHIYLFGRDSYDRKIKRIDKANTRTKIEKR
jgi:DNA (cytosine-5)-methyltransferase 3A